MNQETDILNINFARRSAELAAELARANYDDLFSHHLPDDEEYTEEDIDIQDSIDFINDSFSPDARHIYFDHLNNDPSAPISGITVTDGLGNILIDKDFDTPIPMQEDINE